MRYSLNVAKRDPSGGAAARHYCRIDLGHCREQEAKAKAQELYLLFRDSDDHYKLELTRWIETGTTVEIF